MIKEFIRDVDKPTKPRIKKRYETGKQYGGDQLRQDLDPTAYKHGELALYCDVFNSNLDHLFTFDHGGGNYYVLDRYCITPGYKCKEGQLAQRLSAQGCFSVKISDDEVRSFLKA